MKWFVTFHWNNRPPTSLTVEAPNEDAAIDFAQIGREPFDVYLIEAVYIGPPEEDEK